MAGWLLGAALASACAGCPRLPPEVAAEVAAPDGTAPNHFALRPPPEVDAPGGRPAGLSP